ncbi:MAG: ribonuclease H-like domain-containing protein [Pseudomonadota bacterium]
MTPSRKKHNTILHTHDLPADVLLGKEIAIDTEAMGLNNHRDRLCLVQLTDGNGDVHMVQFKANLYNAPNLVNVLRDDARIKIFHFARFDVAILKQYLKVDTNNVFCTKIASKIARTYTQDHGLKSLLRDLLAVDISKASQSSYWGADILTQSQLQYAAADVIYLHELRNKLLDLLTREGRLELVMSLMKLPLTAANLDLSGWSIAEVINH